MSNVAIKIEKINNLTMTNVDLSNGKDQEQVEKKSSKKSEVYPFQIEDLKNMISYFEKNEMWLQKMLFVLSCNLARRIGDMLNLTWENFYDPKTGNFRKDILSIVEDKTDKLANPHINAAVRNEIDSYIKKTGCNPADNNYQNPVFIQLSGNYKGKVLSYEGYLKGLKKAAVEVGIEYNVGSHSPRKTFGMLSRMIHPGDYDSMEILQTMYNHSDAKTTKHYIGLTKQKIDAYYEDMGTFFNDYVSGDKEYKDVSNKPIINIDANDLRDLIKMAYESGKNNAGETDAMVHVEAITTIMGMIDELKK